MKTTQFLAFIDSESMGRGLACLVFDATLDAPYSAEMGLAGEALVIGLILSADSFSAAVAMGFRPYTRKEAIRFAVSSSLAETLTAFLGALLGVYVLQYISAYDHWIAFLILLLVALHMAWEGVCGLRNSHAAQQVACQTAHSFKKILLVSFVTSLDALGVGMGFGLTNKPIGLFLVSIAVWAFISTLAGLKLAKKLSERFGPIMTLVGASILVLMSFQLLKI